ncbi:MAG: PH domain-containing protein, partial [Ilumatobacter sp.]|nr:PH domain-containing protein [Ilumatobacter sp.]
MSNRALPPPPWPPPAAAGPRTDRSELATPVRQAPIALVFIAWRFVRRLGWSAVIAAFLFVSNGGLALGGLIVAVVVAGTLLTASTLSWYRFTFRVVDDELVVTKGVLSVERLVIPLDRVQSVDIDQRLTHRLFGVVNARVDTAGSSDVEFEIDAVERSTAEALRRVATDVRDRAASDGAERGDAPPGQSDVQDELVIRRSLRDLVIVGLTRAPLAGLVVLAPLIAYGEELGFLGQLESRLERS